MNDHCNKKVNEKLKNWVQERKERFNTLNQPWSLSEIAFYTFQISIAAEGIGPQSELISNSKDVDTPL